ncbi:MAG: hypothetical protein KA714_19810 [Limnoraphis sp. WC205]|jgi:hypothetical protein|nr:hypothetical protein [Limnoraphis sp. WC205]
MSTYWDIINAQRKQYGQRRYLDYLAGKLEVNKPRRRGRGREPSIKLYIKPFKFSLPDKQWLEVTCHKSAWIESGSRFSGFTRESLDESAGETSIKLKNYKPPKVLLERNKNFPGQWRRSAIRNLSYVDYQTTRLSIPFGCPDRRITLHSAFEQLRERFKPLSESERVYLLREKY